MIADLILYTHSLISSSVLLIPFFADTELILLNIFFMMLIAVHWILNNNICALTVIEKILRNTRDDEETFFGRVFGKIYSLGNDSHMYWIVLGCLFLISLIKIFLNNKWEISSLPRIQ